MKRRVRGYVIEAPNGRCLDRTLSYEQCAPNEAWVHPFGTIGLIRNLAESRGRALWGAPPTRMHPAIWDEHDGVAIVGTPIPFNSKVAAVEGAEQPTVTIERGAVIGNNEVDFFNVEVGFDGGAWHESFASEEGVGTFLQGVRAGCELVAIRLPLVDIPRNSSMRFEKVKT